MPCSEEIDVKVKKTKVDRHSLNVQNVNKTYIVSVEIWPEGNSALSRCLQNGRACGAGREDQEKAGEEADAEERKKEMLSLRKLELL